MKPQLKQVALVAAIVSLVIGGGYTFTARHYGSASAAWAAFRGRSLYIERPVISFGVAKNDTRFPITFKITNLTTEPIRLLGASSSCGCVVPPQLPLTIGPHSTIALKVVVRPMKPIEGLLQKVQIYTSLQDEPLVELSIVGSIRAESTGAATSN